MNKFAPVLRFSIKVANILGLVSLESSQEPNTYQISNIDLYSDYFVTQVINVVVFYILQLFVYHIFYFEKCLLQLILWRVENCLTCVHSPAQSISIFFLDFQTSVQLIVKLRQFSNFSSLNLSAMSRMANLVADMPWSLMTYLFICKSTFVVLS